MKILFENWRRFVNEAKIDSEEAKRVEGMLKEKHPEGQWSVLKKLGKGQGGDVYLIQSEKTIERRALKVIQPGSAFYNEEGANYTWVAKNRAALPKEVGKHLPEVFSVSRTDSGADLIQMEVLTSPPEGVLADLIVPSGPEKSATKRQVDVLLSDIDTVRDLITKNVEPEAQMILDRVAELSDKAADRISRSIVNKIMEKWQNFYDSSVEKVFPGQKRPKFFDPSPDWEDPLGILKGFIKAELGGQIESVLKSFDMFPGKKKPKSFDPRSIATRFADNAVDSAISRIEDELKRAPVPLSAKGGRQDMYSHSPKKSALFPEAENILKAINTLKNDYGFVARDIHSNNVMARPGSGDLVIVDLGLFIRKEKKPKAGEAE